jgi:hypothetical protein
MAAWHSGHRICLRNKGPWFESRQGVRFLGKQIIAFENNDLICIVCLIQNET